MKVSKNLLYSIWLFIIMLSVIWQDFYLSTYLGRIGSSPIFVLIPIFVLFELFVLGTKKKWLSYGGEIFKIFLSVLILFFLVSIIYLLLFTAKNEIILLGENVFVKTIKQSLYYVMIILFVRNLDYTLKKLDSIEIISTLSYYIIVLLFIIMIGELIEINKNWVYPNKPMAWPFLHSDKSYFYWYIRLLTSESSYTGPMVVFFAILSLQKLPIKKTKKVIRYLIIFAFVLIYVLNSNSKGFFISALLSGVLMIFFKLNRKYLMITLTGLILLAIFISFSFLTEEALMTASGSIMTRYTGLMGGFYSLIFNPIGTGGLNYVFVTDYLYEVSSFSKMLLGKYADSREIKGWINSGSDSNVAIKSTLGHWSLTIGVFGVALYFYICYKLIKFNKHNRYLLFGAFFFIIVTIFVLPIEMEYPSILFLVVSQYMFFKKQIMFNEK